MIKMQLIPYHTAGRGTGKRGLFICYMTYFTTKGKREVIREINHPSSTDADFGIRVIHNFHTSS